MIFLALLRICPISLLTKFLCRQISPGEILSRFNSVVFFLFESAGLSCIVWPLTAFLQEVGSRRCPAFRFPANHTCGMTCSLPFSRQLPVLQQHGRGQCGSHSVCHVFVKWMYTSPHTADSVVSPVFCFCRWCGEEAFVSLGRKKLETGANQIVLQVCYHCTWK